MGESIESISNYSLKNQYSIKQYRFIGACVLRSISSYVSVAILLMITMVLTAEYVYLIYNKANTIRKTIMSSKYEKYGFQKYVLNNTKIIIINETITGKIITIRGIHKIVMNTSYTVILLAPVNEEVIIITTRDFYIG